MTRRRTVALAQALSMILLLAPWPGPGDLLRSHILASAAQSVRDRIVDASGDGVGCRAGTRRFRGPPDPSDPPWPPGAEPSPMPEASPAPSVDPSADPSAGPSVEPSADPSASALPEAASSPSPDGATSADGAMVRLAAEPSPEAASTPASIGDDADIAPDVETPADLRRQARATELVSGIDVSHHNGDIDFARVRAAGNAFVFIKATQDTEFIDPMFLTNMARARAAGLAAGGYHFFDYTLDGRAQADHFVDRLEVAGGIVDALPPVVDVECWAPIGSSTHALSTARLRDFVERVYERTARLPIIYTSVYMWRQVVGDAEGFEEHPLWAACWGCALPPSIAPGWVGWTFWQTGVDRIRGVGRLDGNYFSGSVEELEALRLRPLGIEGDAHVTASRQVELDLGGRSATHLRTSADGQTWTAWRPIRSVARASLGDVDGPQTLHVQLRNGPGLRSPVYRDAITLDRRGPAMAGTHVRLRDGTLGTDPPTIPVEVSWEATDDEAGLSDASVDVSCALDDVPPSTASGGSAGSGTRDTSGVPGASGVADGSGAVMRYEVPGSAAPGESSSWTASAALTPSVPCRVTVIGRDGVGNVTRVTVDDLMTSLVAASPSAGGTAHEAMVDGDQVGIIARTGPDGGRAAVLLDGEAIGLIELYAPASTEPGIVYVVDLEPSAPGHLSVQPTDTSDPASSGDRVEIVGLVTLSAT
jgi:GH25 family lysozyme M1 (1,4-beta-N-acetylmuramidase)